MSAISLLKKIQQIKKRCTKRFTDYWLGTAPVFEHYIYGPWPEGKRLSTIGIVPSRLGSGVWLSEIEATKIKEIYEALNKKPKLELRVEHGSCMYQEYRFNKYQQKLLAKRLEQILITEVIYEDDES